MNIYEKLNKIQVELKAPKNQYNSFGKYKYRSLEDILEGLKPLLSKYKTTLVINDEVVVLGNNYDTHKRTNKNGAETILETGNRYYVKATARLTNAEDKDDYVESSAYAREDFEKTGMDSSQLTGSTSSYARKYALNGLFAIDDTKDSDFNNKGNQASKPPSQPSSRPAPKKPPASQPSSLQCTACGVGVTEKVKSFSTSKFGKTLCMDCQKKEA